MGTTTPANIRERALLAFAEEKRREEAARTERDRIARMNDESALRRALQERLGLDVHDAPVEWPTSGRSGRPYPVITVDGIEFYRDGNHTLQAAVKREGCDHSHRASVESAQPWVILGALLGKLDEPCPDCEHERREAEASSTTPVPAPPTLGERLEDVVRAIARDELVWREGAAR